MESEAGAAWRREERGMCGGGAKNRNHRAKNSLRERDTETEREKERLWHSTRTGVSAIRTGQPTSVPSSEVTFLHHL